MKGECIMSNSNDNNSQNTSANQIIPSATALKSLAKKSLGSGASDLRNKLAQYKNKNQFSSTQALLLDVSGSMGDPIMDRVAELEGNSMNSRTRKIDALRALVEEFPRTRKFWFSGDCEELFPGEAIPEPRTSTALGNALRHLKSREITHAVVITDGCPDSEADAFQAAIGMKLDLFYVGPMPPPKFMEELAKRTGGSFGTSTMGGKEERKQLGMKITALLEHK